MPDAPIAPSAPAAPITTTGGGNASPQITFGAGTSGRAVQSPEQMVVGGNEQAHAADAGNREADAPFEFKFDGDEETYREKPETEQATQGEKYDASKPFDPELRELLKATPDKLKQVERNHFELRQWQKSGFKTAQEAQKYQQDVSALAQGLGRTDGLKGIEAIRAEAGEWATTMQGFQSGDPAVIDQWFAENPDGMSKLMGPAIMKFAEQNPQAYAHEMSKVMAATLSNISDGGFSALQAFNFLVDKIGKDPDNAKWLNVIGGVFNAIYSGAKNAPTQEGGKSPQLEQREKTIAQRENQIYQQGLVTRNIPFRDSAIKQGILQAFKGMNLSGDSRSDIEANIQRMLAETLKKDEDYQRNGKALLEQKNDDGFSKAYKAALNRNLPGILRRVRRTFAGITAADRKAESQSRTEAGGAVNDGKAQKMPYSGKLVQGGPPPDQIDYQMMREVYGGRQQAADALSRREFIWKGKGKTIYTW